MKQSVNVSIIVPFFNVENYLLDCLTSIADQTYENIEVILINDGSTDDSGIIAEHFAHEDKRFTLYHTKNHGPAHARNIGLKKATGTWIQFVDADDRIANTMTENLLKYTSEDIDLVICGYKGDKIYRPANSATYPQAQFLCQFGRMFTSGLISSPCNKLYRRSMLEKFNILFPAHYTLGEDLLFQLKVLQLVRKVALTKEVPYFYRTRPGSLTKRYIPNYMAIQTELYEETMLFLSKTKSKTKQNLDHVHDVFAQHFRHAASNLFHPDNPMTWTEKNQQLKQLLQTKKMIDFTPFYKASRDEKIFRYFIRTKASLLALFYFSCKERLRMHAPRILQALKQGEKR